MEKDDEVSGGGNSIDFGARIYDSRLGRFSSKDPLYKLTPQTSPFSAHGNNPIYYIDNEGQYITGSTKMLNRVSIIKEILTKAANNNDQEAAKLLTAIKKLEASDVQFHLEEIVNFTMENVGGKTGYDIDNKRIVISVYDFRTAPYGYNEYDVLIHELDHGRQFLEGETDFMEQTSRLSGITYQGGPAYDQYDEFNSFVAQFTFRRIRTGLTFTEADVWKTLKEAGYGNRQNVRISSSEGLIKSVEKKGQQKVFSIINQPVPDRGSIKGDANDENNQQFID